MRDVLLAVNAETAEESHDWTDPVEYGGSIADHRPAVMRTCKRCGVGSLGPMEEGSMAPYSNRYFRGQRCVTVLAHDDTPVDVMDSVNEVLKVHGLQFRNDTPETDDSGRVFYTLVTRT